jgi:predicted Rossmann fold nucleotide-binding protein DprA/Smf involved in DNA uptake
MFKCGVFMKLLIVGSRNIKECDISVYIPENVNLIISGGAVGVDTLAEKYADDNNISKLILRPDYKKYGKAAPIIRNKMMVDIADEILIIWDGKSSGTKATLDYARQIGKNTVLAELTENE